MSELPVFLSEWTTKKKYLKTLFDSIPHRIRMVLSEGSPDMVLTLSALRLCNARAPLYATLLFGSVCIGDPLILVLVRLRLWHFLYQDHDSNTKKDVTEREWSASVREPDLLFWSFLAIWTIIQSAQGILSYIAIAWSLKKYWYRYIHHEYDSTNTAIHVFVCLQWASVTVGLKVHAHCSNKDGMLDGFVIKYQCQQIEAIKP